MYDLSFTDNNGRSIALNYANGIVVSRVTGATGMTVTTKTAQGYQQVGVSVSALTVGGRDIVINGFIFKENAQKKQDLLTIFAPFTRGRLYWEDRYWIDVVVKNAPEIDQEKDSRFTFRLFAADPYFRASEKLVSQNGVTVGSWSFPLTFTGTTIGTDRPHKFGTRTSSTQFIVTNNGQADAPYEVIIEGGADIVNPKLMNTATGDFLLWNDTIEIGERLRIYSEQGRIRVTLTDTSGVEHNAISGLDDDSTLFRLSVGDNILQTSATSGGNDIETTISFYPLYSGVLMYGV